MYLLEKEAGHHEGCTLGYRKCPPYICYNSCLGQKPCCRYKYNQLSSYRNDERIHTLRKCLEHASHGDTCTRKREGQTDYPEGRNSNLKHFIIRIEEAQQLLRNKQSVPISIIETARNIANLKASLILSFFLAP